MNYAEFQKRSLQHAETPEPGDYWTEMLCPVCVVVDVYGNNVIICKTKKNIDVDHWTWDLTKLEMMPKEKFRQWISYGDSGSGTWADCLSKHEWVTEAARNMK